MKYSVAKPNYIKTFWVTAALLFGLANGSNSALRIRRNHLGQQLNIYYPVLKGAPTSTFAIHRVRRFQTNQFSTTLASNQSRISQHSQDGVPHDLFGTRKYRPRPKTRHNFKNHFTRRQESLKNPSKEEKEMEETWTGLLGVLGPMLFPVPFVIASLPLALPAVPMAFYLANSNATGDRRGQLSWGIMRRQ